MSSKDEVNIHVLDAAYKPFPPFADWAAKTVIDQVRWDRYIASLKSKAATLSPDILDRARNIAKRAAALDTGAIEGLYEVDRGFTFTVAFETAAWEAALAQKGEHVRSLFEAQLHAYDYVLDLATKAEPISEAAVRALHQEVCKAQETYRVMTAVGPQEQPLPKGQYKILPNHVRTRKGTDHSYAPVDMTPAEMARLINELRTEVFRTAHPVLQASYAHYGLVVIHPFPDGNGRVARALASAFTYRAVSMPIVILSEHRDIYLNALERADNGEYQFFVDFMLARALDTIKLVDESVRSAMIPAAEQSVTAIKRLYVTRGGYTHEQVDQAGIALINSLLTAVQQVLSKVALPKVSQSIGWVGGKTKPAAGYRTPFSGEKILRVALTSAAPVKAEGSRHYNLLVPTDAAGDDDVQIVAVADPNDVFTARMEELVPTLSGILQIRINMFAETVVNRVLADLKNKAEEKMQKLR